ncbi:MAG: hypothetical protein J6T59_05110 [Bacteroidales bacterium]|nr:hypothetical protein [Bacteroidales bacterium]
MFLIVSGLVPSAAALSLSPLVSPAPPPAIPHAQRAEPHTHRHALSANGTSPIGSSPAHLRRALGVLVPLVATNPGRPPACLPYPNLDFEP